jgi:pimeloyl-ACP methyl ester carboxylesterase
VITNATVKYLNYRGYGVGRVGRSSVLVALLLAIAGCGTSDPDPAPTPSPSAAEREVAVGCSSYAEGGTPVHFDGVDGARLGGLLLGSGPVGVILVHQNDGTMCQWLPYGQKLADRGYRVLAIDLGGFGSSEYSPRPDQDVKQAVAFLRQQGATSVVLMGASLGGTASVSAAIIVEPPVTAVISLSAPVKANGVDLGVRINALTSPTLFVAAKSDSPFSSAAPLLYEGAAAEHKRLLIVDGYAHGVALLPASAVAKAMDDWLATYAPVKS